MVRSSLSKLSKLLLALAVCALPACGADLPAAPSSELPWGGAPSLEIAYAKQKVVYDVDSETPEQMANILDRASFLSALNDADPFDHRIVLVLHGEALHFFARQHFQEHEELMRRAQSLSVGDVVEFRMCAAAARVAGYQPEDIHGFVSMVPMADAEIIRLQQEGFAYMR